MSTFNGIVAEFPDIRVDFFRRHPDLQPPLACFLSHIHSDHLAGLESLRSPFVYCSAATREMLLRLERFPCRINYARGILEARVQSYKHLKGLLKPLPLETPTILELAPNNRIQVTLFNANHCPGAVMFLFEGRGKAALYTGDIRSEPWHVNAIARSPCLVEYSSGLKTLDTIYLDTSFIDDIPFPPKADGIHELLRKVSQYPQETIFHLQAWTYGYEDVWIALSKALGSKIHVDEYKMSVYRALVEKDPSVKFGTQHHLSPEAAGLVGFMCANDFHAGCLTLDESVRLHSCERGNYCPTILNSPIVRMQPIVTRLPSGGEVAEMGVGGGGDDLNREAELDYLLPAEIESLLEMIYGDGGIPDDLKEQIGRFLMQSAASGRKIPLDLDRATFGDNNETDLANAFHSIANKSRLLRDQLPSTSGKDPKPLPSIVTFPYSRHSSYRELCHLLEAFKPRDVWPCTVDPRDWLDRGITVKGLFGEYCSGGEFRHDVIMEERAKEAGAGVAGNESQMTATSAASSILHTQPFGFLAQVEETLMSPADEPEEQTSVDRNPQDFQISYATESQSLRMEDSDMMFLRDSQSSTLSETSYHTRAHAFQAVINNLAGNDYHPISLICTTDNHSTREPELGS